MRGQDVVSGSIPLTALTEDPTRRHQWGRAPLVVVLNAMASLSATQQHLDEAEPFAHAALALADQLGDEVGYAYTLGILGQVERGE